MKGHALYTPVVYVAAVLFIAAAGLAVGMQQLSLLFLPVAMLAIVLLLQNPLLLFYGLIAAIPWSIEYNVTRSIGTDLPDEPLMLLGAFAVVLWMGHNKGKLKSLPAHPLLLLLLMQVLWWAYLVFASTHPLLSLKFLAAKGWFLLAFVALPVLLFKGMETVKRTALILSLSMGVLTVVALVRHAGAGFTFAAINNSVAPFFRNHVNYSALLVCCLPMLVAYIRFSRHKGFLSFFFLLNIAALYFSYARGAWLAFVVGALAYGAFKMGKLLHLYIISILLCVATVFWIKNDNRYLQYAPDFNTTIFHTDFRAHLVATYQLKDVSTAERFYRWVAGVRMAAERPLTGFGTNTFNQHYKSYTVTAYKTWVSRNEERSTVHNFFLLTLLEQGIIGLLLALVLIGYMFYTAQNIYRYNEQKLWKATAACIAVILAMICTVNFLSDLIETDKIGSVFYLCLGILVLGDASTKEQLSKNA